MKFAAVPENEMHGQAPETPTRERKPRTKRARATGTAAASTKRGPGRPKGMARNATSAGQIAGTPTAGAQTGSWMQNGGATEGLMDLGINSPFDLTAPQGATLRIGGLEISGVLQVQRASIKG